MEFCGKCGGIMSVQGGKSVCAACGAKTSKKIKVQASEIIKKKDQIAVIDEEEDNTHPEVDMNCIKCKNKKAFFWTTQTRASDESETKFYKCTKCKHTWRVYR